MSSITGPPDGQPLLCQSQVQTTERSPIRPCGGLVVGQFTAICDCGHVRDRWLCAPCRDVRTQVGVPYCLKCKTGAVSHDCPMTMPEAVR